METVADPGNYYLPASSGLLASALSVAVNVGITLHAALPALPHSLTLST